MTVRVELDERAIAELARRPDILDAIREQVAEPLAALMADYAPKRTGAAAASIGVGPLPGGRPGWLVSYDTRHTYVGINGLGWMVRAASRFGGRS